MHGRQVPEETLVDDVAAEAMVTYQLREHGRHLLLVGKRKNTGNICFRNQWHRYQLDAKRVAAWRTSIGMRPL